MQVVVMVCFARSGGTILNRCLASLPDTVMLSEVSPVGSGVGSPTTTQLRTVCSQAQGWYGIELKSEDFTEGVVELAGVCERTGKRLIVRDWPFGSFAPNPLNDWRPPNRLETIKALEGRCDVVPFAFVRDAIDVYLSCGGEMEQFFEVYLRYVNAIVDRGMRVFKYEDFCLDPDAAMRGMCDHIGLDYSDSWRNWGDYLKVNGDVQLGGGSRGATNTRIRSLPRKHAPRRRIERLDKCSAMIEANRLLGYPTSYHDAQAREGWLANRRHRIRSIVKQATSRSPWRMMKLVIHRLRARGPRRNSRG